MSQGTSVNPSNDTTLEASAAETAPALETNGGFVLLPLSVFQDSISEAIFNYSDKQI